MTNMKTIDINCDMGESYGRYSVGNDAAIFPYISSCNVACGYHGGDPLTIDNTLGLAAKHQTRLGAHPSYPDLIGFGRRVMDMSDTELSASIRYQVCAIRGLSEYHGIVLEYVKPHGALYNKIASDPHTARVVYSAIRSVDPNLSVMGLAGSLTADIAGEIGITHIAEAFADRRYTDEGHLVSRQHPGAVISDPAEAAAQVLDIVLKQTVRSVDGNEVQLRADSVCIHGDTPTAIEIAKEVRRLLKSNGITIGV